MKFLLAILLILLRPVVPTITIVSPGTYQIFQRDTTNSATILIRGRVDNLQPPFHIEARWDDVSDWQIITASSTPSFQGWISDMPVGQHTLEVRLTETGAVVSVPYVGIGDIYALAGQSNSVGQGRYYQHYSSDIWKAGEFALDGTWKELRDPVSLGRGAPPIFKVNPARGSIWPLLATQLMVQRDVPVGFIPCASNGQGVIPWQPDKINAIYDPNTLFGACANRILWQPSGIAGILWVGGEQDVFDKLSAKQYADGMEAIADAFMDCCNARLYLSFIQQITRAGSGYTDAALLEINAGVQMAIDQSDNILAGADFRGITTGVHFITNDELQAAADAWFAILNQ